MIEGVKHTPLDLDPNAPTSPPTRYIRLTAAMAGGFVLYAALAALCIYLSRQPGSIATFWYANAAAVVLLQRLPPRQWPVLLTTVVTANFCVNLAAGDSLWRTLAFLPGNVGEVLLGAALVKRFAPLEPAFSSIVALMRLIVLGAFLPTFVGALVGAGVLSMQGTAPFARVWFSWFIGSAIGAIVVLPLGTALSAQGLRGFAYAHCRWSVGSAILVMLAVALYAPSALPFPFVYVSIALILVAGVGGMPATATGTFCASAITGTLIATGVLQPPPSRGPYSEVFFYLPVLLTLIPPLLLAAALEGVRAVSANLAAREAAFRNLYEKTPAMMYSVDRQGLIVNVSETWLRTLGYRRDEVIGRASLDFIVPASHAYVQEVLRPAFASLEGIKDAEYQMLARDGSIRDIRTAAIPERIADAGSMHILAMSQDVTEEKRLALELAAKQELLEVTLHSIGDGVVTTDADGLIRYLNPIAEALIGWSAGEAAGKHFHEVVHLVVVGSTDTVRNPVALCLEEGQVSGLPVNTILRSRHGTEYGIQDSVSPIRARDGRILGTVMVFQDVSEARGLAQKMSYLAHHDALTNLPNRVLLQDRIGQACHAGQRNGESFAVVFMDLDRFKHINDSLGHAAGDELLKAVATRLSSIVRATDTICRLGGDEFVMLVSQVDDAADVSMVAEKILARVAQPCEIKDTEVVVGVSLGIAIFPSDGGDADTLMRHADAAMYRAKRQGRNQFRFFSAVEDEVASARLATETELRQSIERDMLEVHYQPVVDGTTKCPRAVEALVRWRRRDGTLSPPSEFITLAEEVGLIRSIGSHVLRQACRQIRAWHGTELAGIRVAVNVSPIELRSAEFVGGVTQTLRTEGVDGASLEFEVTESALMGEESTVRANLVALRALGIRVALDDFGTGYSSLSHLRKFPVDTVKIDRSFVDGLMQSATDRAFVEGILAMAASLDHEVVAEGVETPEQAAWLAERQCALLQGYYFCRPLDSIAVQSWLSQHVRVGKMQERIDQARDKPC